MMDKLKSINIKEKLKHLESDLQYGPEKIPRHGRKDIDHFIQGQEVINEFGRFFHTVTTFPQDHRHGNTSLNLIQESSKNVFGWIAMDESLEDFNFRKALFLDTETTGLAGGTGTLPFLIGMGMFTDKGFSIEQFFMRDYNEEYAVLHAISERLKEYQSLVTYNGKSYDMNILDTRFTLARMENSAIHLHHLDLLFASRRLWRRRILDCSLSNVERNILNFHRTDDVPGFVIPGLYFEYLRSRKGVAIEPVFRHNQMDIITLVALAGLMSKIYKCPGEMLDYPMDFVSLGRVMQALVRNQDAVFCFKEALSYSMEKEDRKEVLRLLGFSLKRLGKWDQAVQVWETMAGSVDYSLTPYEELAKYYEHRTREFGRAISVVNRAMERLHILERLDPDFTLQSERRDLEYRMARLCRKMKKQDSA
jgi:uncharacterized protein YprB with RNaseH-like and TPR domain